MFTLSPFAVPIFVVPVNWANKSNIEKLIEQRGFEDRPDDEIDLFSQLPSIETAPEIEDLKQLILNYTPELNEKLGFQHLDYRITSMWLTQYKNNQFIPSHWHTNAFISGIYYPNGCESSPIVFQNPLPWPCIFPNINKENTFNRESVEYGFKEEVIVYFPSWLRHYTMPNQSANKTSIAFNLWPVGEIQSESISKLVL